jgi:tRNA(Arg) A34 adenosine deaminase TadA
MYYPYKKFIRLVDLSRAMFHKPEGRFKHFTYITKGTKVISVGFNNVFRESVKIDGKYFTYPYSGVHSEADAVANLNDLENTHRYTMVNIRLDHSKELQNSKPCPVCLGYICRFGFRAVYYSMNDGFHQLY